MQRYCLHLSAKEEADTAEAYSVNGCNTRLCENVEPFTLWTSSHSVCYYSKLSALNNPKDLF